jgi:ParB family chromosome partitioning protein
MPQIPLDRVRPDPSQPRKKFGPGELEDLAASIRQKGQLQSAIVRTDPELGADRYMIVAGERRFRALKKIGAATIDATVRDDIAPDEINIVQLIENLARADMTPMEEARAFKREIDRGLTEAELAAKLGIKQVWRIGDRLRLLNLAPDLIHLFESGNLSSEAVYEISRLTSHTDQHRIVKMIHRGQLSGYNAIRAAVMAIIEGLSQTDIFAGAPKATQAETGTVRAMERRVEQVARMVQAGFDENQVVVARKVAPDRARLMADRLGLIRKHCLQMENQLRKAAAQGLLLAAE